MVDGFPADSERFGQGRLGFPVRGSRNPGTARTGRFSATVIRWVIEHLGDRSDFDVELLDLRDHVLLFFDQCRQRGRFVGWGNVKLTRLADDLAWWTTTLTAARRQQE